MTGRTDYAALRELLACVLCAQPKDAGLIVCWECYRAHDLRHGTPPRVAELLDRAESQYAALEPPDAQTIDRRNPAPLTQE